jgi:hypothetical protein
MKKSRAEKKKIREDTISDLLANYCQTLVNASFSDKVKVLTEIEIEIAAGMKAKIPGYIFVKRGFAEFAKGHFSDMSLRVIRKKEPRPHRRISYRKLHKQKEK